MHTPLSIGLSPVFKGYTCRWLFLLGLLTLLSSCGGSFCIGGFCFVDEMKVEQRDYDPINNRYTIKGDVDGESTTHSFRMGDITRIDDLSFGVEDGAIYRDVTAIKSVSVLQPEAVQTYYNNYVIPGKSCPAWFMNKNLERMLLMPASDSVKAQLEDFDLPFDGKGTQFQLTGHPLEPHQSSFTTKDGKFYTLDLERYEQVHSNVGSARRKLRYFLVTSLENE